MAGLDDVSILKKGDQLSITILEKGSTPIVLEIATKAPGAGNIQFPHLGLVQAEGLTPWKLATKCKGQLEKYFFKPATVIIELKDSNEGKPPPGGSS
jgi:protein involved in polysaccharide export with SLBB domain